MRLLTIVFLLALSTFGFTANVFGGNPYHREPHPLRIYYFGYNMTNPGFNIGPEFNLSWTRMEKSKCSHGVRVSDRQFLLSPQLGAFMNESSTLSAFGTLELNYRVTFHGGFTFEVFGAGGYAQVLNAGETTTTGSPDPSTDNKAPLIAVDQEAKSGFMPQAGIGIGFDLQKINGHDIPLAFNLRALGSTVNAFELSDIVPSFQGGLIYSF